jgi:hypothetical protein
MPVVADLPPRGYGRSDTRSTDATSGDETILLTITELAARWHRHEDDKNEFWAGARAGWAQSIALLLGVPYGAVNEALHGGKL